MDNSNTAAEINRANDTNSASLNMLDINGLNDIHAIKTDRLPSEDVSKILAQTPIEITDGAYTITDRMSKIGTEVANAFGSPLQASNTSLDTDRLWREAVQPGDGFLFKNTNRPPMLDDSYWYSSNVTRALETRLMHALPKTGPVTQAEIVADAKKICGNDPELTALTLANFSKNIAAVARQQANVATSEGKDFPASTYSNSQVQSVWSRLEHLDPNSDNYGRAGEFYHFYGAIYAHTLGLGFGVSLERKTFHHPNKVENGAGELGIDVAKKVFDATPIPHPQPGPAPFPG